MSSAEINLRRVNKRRWIERKMAMSFIKAQKQALIEAREFFDSIPTPRKTISAHVH